MPYKNTIVKIPEHTINLLITTILIRCFMLNISRKILINSNKINVIITLILDMC